MSSSDDTSRYTPPLDNHEKNRQSRSRDRRGHSIRRLRPEISSKASRQRKRHTYRSRSRRQRHMDDSDSSSSHPKLRRRRRCSADSTESSDCSSNYRQLRVKERKRHRYNSNHTTGSESVSSSQCRLNKYGKRRRHSSSKCPGDYDIFKKLAKLFGRTEHHFEGAQNVIPEFNPDANDQSAASWIRKVNETARIYKWSDRQIIFYAIPKLSGHAKKWYQGLSTINLTWREWQKKIVKAFPDDRNYADRLYEMLERRSRKEESLEDYYHDKARLVKMCGIEGRNAVDCIINGIFDYNIRLNAQGSSLKRPSQLLKYLRRISKKSHLASRKNYPGN